MVLIPTQRPRVPQGRFTATPVVPVRNAAGEQIQRLGAAAQQAGSAFARLGADQQERMHIAAVKKAQALGEERILNADREYINTIGEAATGENRERAFKSLKEQLSTIEKGLEHDVQRRLFSEMSQRRLLSVSARWGTHEDRQIRVFELGGSDSLIESKKASVRNQGPQALAGAAPSAGVPEGAPPEIGPGAPRSDDGAPQGPPSPATMMDSLRAEVVLNAKMRGFGPEQTAAWVQGHLSEVNADLVQDMLSEGRVTEANDYFKGLSKEELHPDARRTLRNQIQGAVDQDEAVRLVDELQDASDGRREARKTEQGPAALEGVDSQIVRAHQNAWRVDATRGELQEAEASAIEFEALSRAELRRQHEAGDISLQVRLLAEGRVMDVSRFRTRLAAERENAQMREIQDWGMDNRDRGFSDLPPHMLQWVKNMGRVEAVSRFLQHGRHTLVSGAIGAFLRIPPDQLRLAEPHQVQAMFRTVMDDSTLKWALDYHEELRQPGKNGVAAVEAGMFKQALVTFGRQESPREVRANAANRPTGETDVFFAEVKGKLVQTPLQEERERRVWIRYNELKASKIASGVDFTPDLMEQTLDEVLFRERVGVDVTGGFDLVGLPASALTGAESAVSEITINGVDYLRTSIPGASRRFAVGGIPDIHNVGDVQGAIIEAFGAAGAGRRYTPHAEMEVFLGLGSPRNNAEFQVAFDAYAAVDETGPIGDASIDPIAAQAASDALERYRMGR